MRSIHGLRFITGLALVALCSGSALAQTTGPAKVSESAKGPVLTDQDGMTLYTYMRDMPGYSNCNDQCAVVWMPMTPAAGAVAAGDWSIILRDDGSKQWAMKGQPIYRYSKDAHFGDLNGDGADKGRWHLAKP